VVADVVAAAAAAARVVAAVAAAAVVAAEASAVEASVVEASVVGASVVGASAVEASAVEALAVVAAAAAGEFAGVVVVAGLILDQSLSVLAEDKLVALIAYGCPYTLVVVEVDELGDVVGVVLNTGRRVVEVEPADEDDQVLQGHCADYKLQVVAYTHSH
jgi:hypothetical protein